jgi:hypothetical protein
LGYLGASRGKEEDDRAFGARRLRNTLIGASVGGALGAGIGHYTRPAPSAPAAPIERAVAAPRQDPVYERLQAQHEENMSVINQFKEDVPNMPQEEMLPRVQQLVGVLRGEGAPAASSTGGAELTPGPTVIGRRPRQRTLKTTPREPRRFERALSWSPAAILAGRHRERIGTGRLRERFRPNRASEHSEWMFRRRIVDELGDLLNDIT